MIGRLTVVAVAVVAIGIASPASAAPTPEVVALRAQVNALKKELRDLKKDVKALGKDATKAADTAKAARTLAAQASQGALGAKGQADLAIAKTNCLVNVVPATWWTNFVFLTADGGGGVGTGMDIAVGADVPKFYLAGVNPSCVPSVFPSFFSTPAPS